MNGAGAGRHHPVVRIIVSKNGRERPLPPSCLGQTTRAWLALQSSSFNGRLRDELLNKSLFWSLPTPAPCWKPGGATITKPTALKARLAYAEALAGKIGRFAALLDGCAARPFATPPPHIQAPITRAPSL